MSEVATKNLTFWDTTNYKYPGFGQTAQISDGLGGTIGITYNKIDYDDRAWRGKPDGDTPITEDRLLSGEIENKFSLTGQVKGITATMPQIRTIGRENNYSVTLDFSKYKASLAGSKATDGATCGDTYLAISRFFNGSKAGYTTITVTATTLDGSPVNLTDWKLFNSGTLGKGHNARIFLDAATQTISGKNSQGKQEFCPTPPNPGTSFGTDTGLGLFQLPSDQRYTSITLTFKQKKIKGVIPNDLHDIYVASNTTSTSPASATPATKPMDINSGLQLHLPLNEIVENAAKEKEVVDISGNKLNGKVRGAAIVADSRFGNCINFDGVDDYIELPKETIPQTGEITISFWAYGGKSLPKNTVLISAYNQGNQPLLRVYLPWSDRRIILDYGNPFDRIEKVGEAVDFKDKWTYWTFTKNVAKGEMNIYLNGSLWHSGTAKDKAIDSVVQVMFGRETHNSYYNGQIAHLRIYDRVLSPEDINECMKVDGTPPPMDINSGLQLHLPLNEIVENAAKEKEVVDISAAKLHGKIHGATVVAEQRFGNCLNFNGNNDYVIINPMPNFPSESMTVLCWVRSNNQRKEGTVLSYAKSSTKSYNEFQIYNVKNITPTVNNKWHSTGVAFNDGEWHCVAITWQSSDGEFKVYKDGKEVHSKVISKGNPIATGGVLVLGQEQDKLGGGFAVSQAFEGQMAHLRMYNRVLSTEDINECMKVDGTPPPIDINRGLQFHLPLDEIVENAAKEKEVVDVSPAKLKGKVNGKPIVVADSKLGNCLNFDGVDDYIQMPEMNIDYSQGLTVEAWVHYKSFKNWSRIIDFGNAQGSDNILLANEGTTKNLLLDVYQGATQNRIKADGILELKQWVYVAVTVDGSGNSKVYNNGEEVQSGLVHLPNNLNRTKNYIGKSNWSADQLFHGKMSNLRMYNRALSPEEINECMKVDETPPPMDINRGLQLHLPLNEIVENAAKEKEVVDVSTSKLNGKVNGATVVADSKLGNCLNFDGVDDYIQMPEMNIDYSQGFTVGAWVYYESFKIWSRIIDFGIEARNENILLSNINTAASVAFHHYPGTTNHPIDANGILEQKKWLYLAATIDESGNGKIYMNGQEVASGSSSIPNNVNRTKNYIGKSNVPTDEYFHGKMINLRVYNRGLSPEEINECMKVDETRLPMDINRGLQLHLPLNEIVENAESEKEVVDVSPGKLNGKVNGTPEIVNDPNLGNCINFDGVDDYIELSTATIPETGQITISFWANGGQSLPKGSSVILAQEKSDHRVVNIELPWSNSVIHFDCGIEETYSERVEKIAEAVDFKDKWHYWTFTKNAATGEMNIYQNGSLWQSGTGKHKQISSITKVRFGCGYGFYEGKVAHLRIYDRVLSPEEINECMKVDGTPPRMDINRGLQLHLPLNKIVENSAKEKEVVDVSAAKLNGKVNGATVVADSKFGKCINFDGVDDNIQIPEMNVDYSKGFTVEAWCYSNKFKNYSRIIDFANGPTEDNIIFSHYVNNSILLVVYLGSNRKELVINQIFENNQWLHLAATVDQLGNAKIYKNGQQVGEGLLAIPNTVNRTKNYLGNTQNAKSPIYFQGKMSNLRLYNRPLSPEEINECIKVDEAPPPIDINRGLQLHLPLNEIIENAAKEKEVVDVSPAKLNGKVHSATVVADDRFGNCVNLDGVDDYIELPTATIPETGEITISFWANGDKSLPKSNSIISAEDKNSNRVLNIHLTWGDSQLHFDCGNQTSSFDRISKIAEAIDFKDQWTYWTFTKNVATGEMNLYLNGSLWHSGTDKNKPLSPVTKAMFGCYIDRYFYHGKVAHLRIYDRVLSPEEINECMKVDGTPPMDINRGLQLHLPLNEIVENAAKEKEVVDVSAGKLNGKVNGATVVADSNFGNCLSFDGVDDYIQMPEMNIDYSQGITVGAWVNYDSFKYQSRVIDFGHGANNNNIILGNHARTKNGWLVVMTGGSAKALEAKGIFEESQWVYLTATVDESGNAKVYQNAQEVGCGLVNAPSSVNRTTNYIGKSNWSVDEYFHGKMLNLRIYNRVLSPEEINECMKVDGTPPINRGLQLHLPLNEIVENAAKEKEVVDISPAQLKGKVNGNPEIVADDRFGNCINFDGTNDYIELPTTTIPETGEITISFWANGGKSLPNQNSIILAQDKSNHRVINIHLPWSNSNVYFDCGNTTTSDDTYDRIYKIAETADFQSKWTYWVFTKNVATGEMKIYLNGVLWQSGTGKERALNSTTTVKFGSGYGSYHGKVAHLRIYDRVLSPEEINELMTVDETGTAGETDSTSTTDGTDATGETDTTSTTDGTDATGETDSTSTTDGTGETDSTSTTNETDTTGETDTTSTTDGTNATGETDTTSTTDETSQPIDINSGLHFNLPLNEIVENSAKEKEVVDASGGKLNGKVYGAKVMTDPNFGDCISFDGVDDYIELPPTAIPETNEITISFWANGGESLPKQSSILLAEDKTNHRVVNIHLPWSDSNVCFDCGNKTTSFDRIEQLAQVSDFKGKWNHWAFTKNIATGEMKIYLNGSLWQTVTGKDQELSQITQIKLGCGYGFYEGKVAHLRIYDRVLSQEEINELMKANQPATTSTTGETDTTSTTDEADTTQKPMEYQIYQVKGNPTIKTGYSASEWTAVIAGFNCGAKQKHKASAFTIMPLVEDEEWKIKCDLKDTDDRYWDVAVLFIRNNMVNRVSNFYR